MVGGGRPWGIFDEMTMRHTKTRKWLLFGLALTSAVLIHPGVPADDGDPEIRVIVHAENPTQSMTTKQVSNLMLKKTIRWSDGTIVDPVDLSPSLPVRDVFSSRILGRSTRTVVNYWQRQVFSGSSVPPPTVGSEDQVVAHVRSHRGGIGYVSSVTRLVGVRELALTER